MELKRRTQNAASLTPEHDKRGSEDHGFFNDWPLHPEIDAAYDYVSTRLHTSDYEDDLIWHGWALREAFLAGISYAVTRPLPPEPTTEDEHTVPFD